MRLAFVVTEFPKVTETFILRDLMQFLEHGHDLRIYHLRPFRRHEVVHDFARPLVERARRVPLGLGLMPWAALVRSLLTRPGLVFKTLWQILRAFRTEPVMIAKSLIFFPKALAIGREVADWRADHVHAEFAGHPATCAWIVGRVSGVPYSVSCRAHDIFITQSLLDVKLAEAAFVRTITEFNCEFLREKVAGLAEREIHLIPSSVDVASIPALPAPSGDHFFLFYVGSHHERKGIDIFLRALANMGDELGDWHCEIAGGGPETKNLVQLSESLGLADRVQFVGRLPFEEVSRGYERANVVVVPSIIGPDGATEGIPNVVIETLAHQRPVIATRLSGIPELVRNGETGHLVTPGDVDELGEAIRSVHRDPARAYEMARQGREAVAGRFDLRVNAKAQLRLFEEHSDRQGS